MKQSKQTQKKSPKSPKSAKNLSLSEDHIRMGEELQRLRGVRSLTALVELLITEETQRRPGGGAGEKPGSFRAAPPVSGSVDQPRDYK